MCKNKNSCLNCVFYKKQYECHSDPDNIVFPIHDVNEGCIKWEEILKSVAYSIDGNVVCFNCVKADEELDANTILSTDIKGKRFTCSRCKQIIIIEGLLNHHTLSMLNLMQLKEYLGKFVAVGRTHLEPYFQLEYLGRKYEYLVRGIESKLTLKLFTIYKPDIYIIEIDIGQGFYEYYGICIRHKTPKEVLALTLRKYTI